MLLNRTAIKQCYSNHSCQMVQVPWEWKFRRNMQQQINSQTHKMQNCAFVAADTVCKSVRKARNDQYDSHGYFIIYLQTSVQYFSSPTHYSRFREVQNVFVSFLYFWLFSYHIMFKMFIPLPWRLNGIVRDTNDPPQNWGTMVLHLEQNSQYCIRLAR